jgi:hypothetical protein
VSNAKKLSLGTGAASLVLFGLVIALLLAPEKVSGTGRLGAILTFVAALAGSLVSALSLLIGKQSEDRLRTDAAMRAGEIIGSSQGGGVTNPAAVASGLLALSQLGQCELAVALLVELWPPHRSCLSDGTTKPIDSNQPAQAGVSNEVAILVIDKALRSSNRPAQLVAAELLCRHSLYLSATQSLHWPSAIEGCWRSELSPRAKLLLVEALVRMTIGKLPGDLIGDAKPPDEAALRAIAVRLYGIWRDDEDRTVKGCIGKLIDVLVDKLDDLKYRDFVQGNQKVLLSDLQKAARSAAANPDEYLDQISTELAGALRDWVQRCERGSSAGSCLSSAVIGTSAEEQHDLLTFRRR